MKNGYQMLAYALVLGMLGFSPASSLFAQDALLVNGDFQNDAQGWSLTPGYQIEKGSGCNGTAALAYSNSDPEFPYAQPKHKVYLESRSFILAQHCFCFPESLVVQFNFRTVFCFLKKKKNAIGILRGCFESAHFFE